MDLNSITEIKYTWQVQRPGDYPEQGQEMGSIDKAQTLRECQSFPWKKESPSKIIINSDNARQLIITKSYEEIFTIEYADFKKKHYSEFTFIKEAAKGDLTFEQVIEYFFEDVLNQHGEVYKLKSEGKEESISIGLPPNIKKLQDAKEKALRQNLELSISPYHLYKIGGMTFFWFLVSMTFLAISLFQLNLIGFLYSLPIAIIWLPVFYLHYTYYRNDRSAQITLDFKIHTITYRNGSQEKKFGRKDLQSCQVVNGHGVRNDGTITTSWRNYSYVLFTLKNQSQVIITCFIARPEELVNILCCNSDEKAPMLAWI